MSERPASQAIDALAELPSLAAREIDAVADDVREQTAQLSGTLRNASRGPLLAGAADDIESLAAGMQTVLADLPAEVSRVIEDEITAMQNLLAPDTTAAQTGLTALPVFDRTGTTDHGHPADGAYVYRADESPDMVRFSTEAEFNAAAESPRPDTTYRYRDVEWRTDELSRTISVSGTPTLEPATRRPRRQAEIGHQGKPTDVGFHLLGHAFGGPANPLNVVPANGYRLEDGLANLNQGAYQQFENEIRNHLKAGRDVRIEIHVVYKPGNTTRRPDKFIVRYTVDGEHGRMRKFTNK